MFSLQQQAHLVRLRKCLLYTEVRLITVSLSFIEVKMIAKGKVLGQLITQAMAHTRLLRTTTVLEHTAEGLNAHFPLCPTDITKMHIQVASFLLFPQGHS